MIINYDDSYEFKSKKEYFRFRTDHLRFVYLLKKKLGNVYRIE